MTSLPINRPIKKGWYRAAFHDLPDFTLLVPAQWNRHLTFAQLCSWPEHGKWKQLTYVPAPRQKDTQRVML